MASHRIRAKSNLQWFQPGRGCGERQAAYEPAERGCKFAHAYQPELCRSWRWCRIRCSCGVGQDGLFHT